MDRYIEIFIRIPKSESITDFEMCLEELLNEKKSAIRTRTGRLIGEVEDYKVIDNSVVLIAKIFERGFVSEGKLDITSRMFELSNFLEFSIDK